MKPYFDSWEVSLILGGVIREKGAVTADGQQLVCPAVAPEHSCGWLQWDWGEGVRLCLFCVLPSSRGWISLGCKHCALICSNQEFPAAGKREGEGAKRQERKSKERSRDPPTPPRGGVRVTGKGPEVGREIPGGERGKGGGVAGCLVRGWGNCLDLGFVLVCSGCYDKIPQTGWLVNNRTFFLLFLTAGCPRLGRPCSLVLVRALVLVRLPTSLSVLTGSTEGLGELSFRSALTPFIGFHPHDLSAPQRPHLLIPSLSAGRRSSTCAVTWTQFRAGSPLRSADWHHRGGRRLSAGNGKPLGLPRHPGHTAHS